MTKLGTKGFQHFPQPLLFYAFASKYKWQGEKTSQSSKLKHLLKGNTLG
jgi:hypothetical protein